MNFEEQDWRIGQMVKFIKQEAEEKSQQIIEAARQKIQKEKNKIYSQKRDQIIEAFAQKEEEIQLQRKLEKSKVLGKARLEIQEYRGALVDSLKEQIVQRVQTQIKNKEFYREIMEGLVLQGLLKLLEEKVFVQCLKEDQDLVREVIPQVVKKYQELTL